jgi:glycosyltransferase involved in cell wall biosynthesis
VKLAFLCGNFPPEVRAGTEMVALALARELRSAGHEVVVLCTSDIVHDGTDVRRETFDGIPVYRLFKKLDEWDGGGLHRPRVLALASAILREERPELLHVHSFASFGSGLLAAAAALGIPSVLTFHDVWVTCPRYFRLPPQGVTCPTGAGREPCAACVNLELKHPDVAVIAEALRQRDRDVRAEVAAASAWTAPSATAAEMVRAHLPLAQTIEVVPHGSLESSPLARAAAPAPGERLRIGSFGNLVPEKGVLELVDAVAGLDCDLRLAGRFLSPEFEKQVRKRAAERNVALVYSGPFGADTPHPALRLHLAVFPSKCQETYGLVVDEALVRGVPVVVSDQGALAERAQTGGVLVSSLAGLSASLRTLVAEPMALARLRAQIPTALPTIADAAVRYRAIYERLLARRG